jgi:tetratricopeptide (TPR) repeat protein
MRKKIVIKEANVKETNWLEILGWNPQQIDDLRYVAYSYIKEGKYDIALTFFEALIVLNPQSAYDLQTLGALYLQMGNNLAALDHLERAIKIDKTHAPTLLNRAKALFILGYKKQGQDQLTALLEHPSKEINEQAKALQLAYRI